MDKKKLRHIAFTRMWGWLTGILLCIGCHLEWFFHGVDKEKLFQSVIILILSMVCMGEIHARLLKGKVAKKMVLISGLLISFINSCGIVLRCAGTLFFVESLNIWKVCFLLLGTLGNGIAFYYIAMCVFCYFDNNKISFPMKKKIAGMYSEFKHTKLFGYINRHFYGSVFLFIMVCWSPWLIIYYPGSVNWDMTNQLAEYFGLSNMSNHHPVLSTLIMGTIVETGEKILDYNFGAFLYILFQAILCSLTYAYIIKFLKTVGCSKTVIGIVTLFYGLVPLWGGCAQFGDKDIVFCGIFVSFAIINYLVIFEYADIKNLKVLLLYFLTGLVSCLLRNNVIYIVIISVPFIVFSICKGKKLCILKALLVMIICTMWVNNLVLPHLNVRSASSKEAFSLMFQQTARVVKYEKEKLSEEEYKAINGVLDIETIGEKYIPYLSDPVKATYKIGGAENESELRNAYLKTWAKMFFKYPKLYIEAALELSSGYYCFIPEIIDEDNPAPSERFWHYISGRQAYIEAFELKFHFSDKWREGMFEYSQSFRNGILGFFYQCAFYTWGYVMVILYLFYNRKIQKIGAIIPILLTIGICCITPANDCFRYFITISAFFPMLATIGKSVQK